VQIGWQGVTPAVVRAVSEALDVHELIKVKVLESAPKGRFETAQELAEAASAELVQVLGRTMLLYRPAPQPQEKRKGPPRAALHATIGGAGDRPAARMPRRAITQGASTKKTRG